MNLKRNGLAVALSAVVGLGVSGQAAADVYGLGYLDVDNLSITFTDDNGQNFGAINSFTFSTGGEATLNGTDDPVSGSANCNSLGVPACGPSGAGTVLSGTVQNAPGSAPLRGENDFSIFGQTSQFSNAESSILDAQIVGDFTTSTEQIAESNLTTGFSAQSNTVVNSNTSLAFTFTGAGDFTINFDAFLNVLADVSGGDTGLAQANSGFSVSLTEGTTVLAAWSPDGISNTFTTCAAGLTCLDTEAATSLNNALTSPSGPVQVTGGGNYNFFVDGLVSSNTYGIALNATTSTDLIKAQIPEPGTLLLLGAGLLGVGASRRKARK